MKDIELSNTCYEFLQKELHSGKGGHISRFTEHLSTPAKKLISEENQPFGKNISEAVMRVVISIAECNSMELSGAQIKEMAIRPVSQFLQNRGGGGNVRTIRTMQMKQAAFLAALIMSVNGFATIVSTKNFSTQHWRLIKHTSMFFDKRPGLLKEFERFYKKKIKLDSGFKMPSLSDKEYLVKTNAGVPKEPYKLFQMLKFRETFDSKERKTFNIHIVLVGKMTKRESWES